MVCSQSCHIYPHTRSHFYTFRFALVTDVESRPPDDDMVGNKIARRTAFIHRAAYLRHIFGVLWSYVSYTFRIRFDLLSVILLFGDFGRRRLKLQLYLSVECCKFGLQLFQFVLLLPYLPGYLLQLWDLLFLHLVLRFVLVNDGRNSSPMRSGNCVRRLPGQPSPTCSLCHTRILILRENLSSM